ncbi:MAG: sigma-70 family RNA polymerase sigma factor [Chloroflexi bacterium]|nr:sigma-70 family RNA polymerase sigma factor [Chloroflexota bacterium]
MTCEQTERVHLRIDLERATARLTQKQRVALWLVLQGYTQAEIAAQHGVGRPAIAMRIRRARETLETMGSCGELQ